MSTSERQFKKQKKGNDKRKMGRGVYIDKQGKKTEPYRQRHLVNLSKRLVFFAVCVPQRWVQSSSILNFTTKE